jgi:hypothetical protein
MPDARRTFKVPGGPIVPVLAAVTSLWLLTGVSRKQAIAGSVALACGAMLYVIFRRMNRTPT